MDAEAETIRLIVGFHEAGQFGVRDRALKAAGAAVGRSGRAPLSFILRVEFGDQFLGEDFQLLDAFLRRADCSAARIGSWATTRRCSAKLPSASPVEKSIASSVPPSSA